MTRFQFRVISVVFGAARDPARLLLPFHLPLPISTAPRRRIRRFLFRSSGRSVVDGSLHCETETLIIPPHRAAVQVADGIALLYLGTYAEK